MSFESMRAAYEGVESTFGGAGEVEVYRAAALAKTAHQADFLRGRLAATGRAAEVACGNGRLLVALVREGAIDGGIGVDIASSRIEFAREWAQDAALGDLRFVAGNALELDLGTDHILAACITGAFGYFDAHVAGSGARLLDQLHAALAHGGLLVLELYQHPTECRLVTAAGGRLRSWSELPESDPWRFYLSDVEVRGRLMTHRKTFIHRTDGRIDDGRVEKIVIYDETELRALVREAGFEQIELHEGWSDEPYAGGESLVLTAIR